MSSREKILQAISQNKPELVEEPDILIDGEVDADLIQKFISMLESVGGKAIEVEGIEQIKKEFSESIAEGNRVVNTISALGEIDEEVQLMDAQALQNVYRVFIEGSLGVAENGAVWIDESNMKNRLLPFICEHLILVLDGNKIVSTMHEAYQCINIAQEGFGVFLAGPSKTADIEQSLVIGAHGARSVTVYLL